MTNLVAEQVPVITLVGPPNSGKTSIFNILSGRNYKTVNYPGSTVEYHTSRFLSKFALKADLLDSPGIVSLNPNSPDEKIAVDSLYTHFNENKQHLVINTVDASQLSRQLLLSMQLLKAGFHVIIALTMKDILYRKGFDISEKKLSEELNCDVVCIDGRNKKGTDKLICAINQNLNNGEDQLRLNRNSEVDSYEKNGLINLYKVIEQIVDNVTIELHSSDKPDVKSANKELTIVNSTAQKNDYSIDELTLKIDKVLLHRKWGFITFVLIMGLTFTSIFWIAEPVMNLVDDLFSNLNLLASDNLGTEWFSSLISDGLISGAGAVMVFVPQIVILFLILGVLEDSGYLARGAMLIDKPLSKVGLNGRSFVPMISGFACAIPAMLAARTIPNRKERLLTIFILPLMSCSARLPVYALLIAFLVPSDKLWIGGFLLAAIYLFSTFSSLIVAAVLNKFRKKVFDAKESSSFILELPSYRIPKLSAILTNTYNSSKEYILKAGPIILLFSMIIWFLTYFPNTTPEGEVTGSSIIELQQNDEAERFENSYMSGLGKIIQPLMSPLGMDWRVGVSLISAFAAREVFVSSLALIFKVTEDDDNLGTSLLNSMDTAVIEGTNQKLFTPATTIGLIIFFVFALQCLSTVAISRKETGSWKIPMLQVTIFTLLAYIATLITVNGLRLIGVA
jgi:ferrous iron transport protein B